MSLILQSLETGRYAAKVRVCGPTRTIITVKDPANAIRMTPSGALHIATPRADRRPTWKILAAPAGNATTHNASAPAATAAPRQHQGA